MLANGPVREADVLQDYAALPPPKKARLLSTDEDHVFGALLAMTHVRRQLSGLDALSDMAQKVAAINLAWSQSQPKKFIFSLDQELLTHAKTFVAAAVNVKPFNESVQCKFLEGAKIEETDRGIHMTAIMGPSGAGKSLFALYGMVFEPQRDYIRLLVKASNIFAKGTPVTNPLPTFIATFLVGTLRGFCANESVNIANYALHFIIDEAEHVADDFTDEKAWTDLIAAIRTELMLPSHPIHLTLCGTMLDVFAVPFVVRHARPPQDSYLAVGAAAFSRRCPKLGVRSVRKAWGRPRPR